ncbi:MAG: MogA/MoaB family molybdenum cofactor biosynthesis protein [Thermoanaerobaculia bacterium]
MREAFRARVITCSDAASRGEREDRSGPAVRDILAAEGYQVDAIVVLPDERSDIANAIVEAVDRDSIDLVVTTGGTGVAPRDVTPEATDDVTQKKIPGFGELMRAESLRSTKMAPLSRCQAAIRGPALVVNLPGGTRGATENLRSVLHLIPHVLDLLRGRTAHRPT